MITTKNGETVDFENQFVKFDGQEYSINDLMHLKNIYMQFVTAEYILENNEDYSEEECWEIAGITREKMDKYDMSEEDAIEEAIIEYGSPQKSIETRESYESEWDFSQFTEEQYNSYPRYTVKLVELGMKKNADISLSTPNNDMFIKYKDLYVIPRVWDNTDEERKELLIDIYIPKDKLMRFENIESILSDCRVFDINDLKNDSFLNQIFIERKNDELIATECVSVNTETIDYMGDKDINQDKLFSYVKDFITYSNPEIIFDTLKPYFEAESFRKLDEARKEFPQDIVMKEKLTMLDYKILADYYKKIMPLVTEGKDTISGERLLIKEMIKDGLSDMRIKTLAVAMQPDFEHFSIISDLLRESNIKNFRKEAEYSRTHTGQSGTHR